LLEKDEASLNRNTDLNSLMRFLKKSPRMAHIFQKANDIFQNKTINVLRNGRIQNKNDMFQGLCARVLIEIQFDISFQFIDALHIIYIFF
jgi:hypothetical protein